MKLQAATPCCISAHVLEPPEGLLREMRAPWVRRAVSWTSPCLFCFAGGRRVPHVESPAEAIVGRSQEAPVPNWHNGAKSGRSNKYTKPVSKCFQGCLCCRMS